MLAEFGCRCQFGSHQFQGGTKTIRALCPRIAVAIINLSNPITQTIDKFDRLASVGETSRPLANNTNRVSVTNLERRHIFDDNRVFPK